MEIDQITLKTLMSKLSQPVHISYIARYILKQEYDVTNRVMKKLIEDDFINGNDTFSFGETAYSVIYKLLMK